MCEAYTESALNYMHLLQRRVQDPKKIISKERNYKFARERSAAEHSSGVLL